MKPSHPRPKKTSLKLLSHLDHPKTRYSRNDLTYSSNPLHYITQTLAFQLKQSLKSSQKIIKNIYICDNIKNEVHKRQKKYVCFFFVVVKKLLEVLLISAFFEEFGKGWIGRGLLWDSYCTYWLPSKILFLASQSDDLRHIS